MQKPRKNNVLNIHSNVSQIFEVHKRILQVFMNTIIIKHINTHAISCVKSVKRIVPKLYL